MTMTVDVCIAVVGRRMGSLVDDEMTDSRSEPVGDRRAGGRLALGWLVCGGGTDGSQRPRRQASEKGSGAESWAGHPAIMTHGAPRPGAWALSAAGDRRGLGAWSARVPR